MDFQAFKKAFQSKPFILSHDVMVFHDKPQALRNQLSRWQKKGLILPLKKGMYVFNDVDRQYSIHPLRMANVLYEPSYVSLEYALQFYGLIPERVKDITSITTHKTKEFHNKFGVFIYQHLKPNVFRGFTQVDDHGQKFFIADPEKALVDFIYLNLSRFDRQDKLVFEGSLRLQHMDTLQPRKIMEFGQMFDCKKLMHILGMLTQWMDEVGHD